MYIYYNVILTKCIIRFWKYFYRTALSTKVSNQEGQVYCFKVIVCIKMNTKYLCHWYLYAMICQLPSWVLHASSDNYNVVSSSLNIRSVFRVWPSWPRCFPLTFCHATPFFHPFCLFNLFVTWICLFESVVYFKTINDYSVDKINISVENVWSKVAMVGAWEEATWSRTWVAPGT